MNHVTSILLVGLSSLLAITAAVPQRSEGGRQNCNDGTLCQCQSVLDEGAYRSARFIVQCLDEMRISHDFSSGSQIQDITTTCQRYNVRAIKTARLRVCVYKKIGYITNVRGVDQWNLPFMRNVGIVVFTEQFSKPEEAWIRNIFITTFLTCHADPTNFEVFPFDDCLDRAQALILEIVQRGSQTNNNLSKEKSDFAMGAKLSSELLGASNEALEQAKDLDVLKLM